MENQERSKQERAMRMLVWIGVAAAAMFFAAFTSAYIVLQADHFWVKDRLPSMFSISTAFILASSVTMYAAQKSIKKGNSKGLTLWLICTLLLGMGFATTQYFGWKELQREGKFFVGNISSLTGEYGTDYVVLMKGEELVFVDGNFYAPTDIEHTTPLNERVNSTFNVSASFLFVLSGLHIMHLAGGLVWLIVLLFRSISGKFTLNDHAGIDLGSIYWHFLDLLWVYLFLFLLLIR